MPTNQQRREAERRRLQRQLEERRTREVARRRFTLITSIVGTLAVLAIVITVIVITTTSGTTKKKPAAVAAGGTTPAACAGPSTGTTSSYQGVTLTGATDLKHKPKVTAAVTTVPGALECQDVVVGTGKAATPTSSVTVQYIGVLYRNGVEFDSSWAAGKAATFSLTQVVPGFTKGIGGTGAVAPMKVGGRRVMILPPALGYGAQAQAKIPANSTLVFVVDLVKVA